MVQLFHLLTGALIFNKSNEDTINIDSEVTSVCWFNEQTTYWFTCTCWEGKVAFFSHPYSLKGRQHITSKIVSSLHKRDVTAIDSTEKSQLVTGSMDNLICFWNIFTCQPNKQKQVPANLADPMRGNTIQALKYATPKSNELLLVFFSLGEIMCLDTLNEEFVQTKNGSYTFAKVKKYSTVDMQQGYCLCVSEKGAGFLFKVKVTKVPHSTRLQAMLDLQYEFKCTEDKVSRIKADIKC